VVESRRHPNQIIRRSFGVLILARIIFTTGTDTGVGKNLLTGLLLHHLRQNNAHALAMKPFCSGSRADPELLHAVQDGKLKIDEITRFLFAEPLAPLVAAQRHRRSIPFPEVSRLIRRIASRCQCLLIEGIGGLLAPLGERFTVRDLIARLDCEVVLVSCNRLRTINHTLLTVDALKTLEKKGLKAVLMSHKNENCSTTSNHRILSELLAPTPLLSVSFLGGNLQRFEALKKSRRKIQKTLARILGSDIVSTAFFVRTKPMAAKNS
jgi:dethiobiotin synthetase